MLSVRVEWAAVWGAGSLHSGNQKLDVLGGARQKVHLRQVHCNGFSNHTVYK